MRKFYCLCAALLVSMFAAPSANADALVQGFTGGSNFAIFNGGSTGDVIGFRFTAIETGFLMALGVLDDPSDGVLDSAHTVGVWRNSDMALLGSVDVDSSGILTDGFYYESVTPIAITAGTEYTLGALYTATDDDFYISSPDTVDLMHISTTNGVFPSVGNLGFVYPDSDSGNLARIGPNAIFNVPEPSAIGLFALAALGLVLRRRP